MSKIVLGTPKADKHRHFAGISLASLASLQEGLHGISLSYFSLRCFKGPFPGCRVSGSSFGFRVIRAVPQLKTKVWTHKTDLLKPEP